MGFFKSVGKGIVGGADTIGKATILGGEVAIKGSKSLGNKAISTFANNPALTVGAIGTASAAGYLSHDLAGEDAKKGATDGAIIGTAGALVGGAGAITTLGAATVGAGVSAITPAIGLASKSVKIPEQYKFLGGSDSRIKLTKTGAAIAGAGLAFSAIKDMGQAYEKSRMGQSDGMMHTSRPNLNTAGATGELVFAMHKQR